MEAWRICQRRYVKEAFGGKGAFEFGGRWNSPGENVVYCATTLSLAALELFVNLDVIEAPDDLVAIHAEFPNDLLVERWMQNELPHNWRDSPPPKVIRDLGTEWLKSLRTAALLVPSAVIPEDFNLLLNPLHPDFQKLKIGKPRPFRFDPRMWKQR